MGAGRAVAQEDRDRPERPEVPAQRTLGRLSLFHGKLSADPRFSGTFQALLSRTHRRRSSTAACMTRRTSRLALLLASAVAVPAAAQDRAASRLRAPSSNPFEHILFGVALEGFYQYNWNEPYDRVNLLRAYDTRANVFGIQQANIVVESAPNVDAGRRFGARIDLQFGQATETVQGSAANEPRPDVYRHIWQAYGTYVFPVGRGLQTDFGKFASMLGYETNYAKDNNHFSRAYLFNFLPFYHSGLRVTLPVNDKVTVMYMLTNGIQQTEDFNDFKSNHFAAIVKPHAKVTWTTNYYFGQEQPDRQAQSRTAPDGFFRVFDTYVTYTATSTLELRARRQLRHQRGQQGRRPAGAAGRRRLRALSGHRARGARDPLRAARRRGAVRRHRPGAPGSHRDRSSTSSPTASWCAASSAATGRTSRSSPARGPAICATTRTPRSSAWCGGSATSKERGERHGRTSSSSACRCCSSSSAPPTSRAAGGCSEATAMTHRIDRRPRDLGAPARVSRLRDAAPGEVLT